ncbi:uncharacterized protein LOC126909152 [Daktulosphaira vitifoliae]|uniref:uncharacterized protein LOC126909152 n=1 Tax=Daktulosphaira vitifoliae TaxID=58002 RepID=UPI0021AAEEA9|nr:uncharacterized protein LOC126909152 [Daktulosphaira vitifoliae]
MKIFTLVVATALITACSVIFITKSRTDGKQSIYKPTIKDLKQIQNHFLWHYIKDELVHTPFETFFPKPYYLYVEESIITKVESRINRSYWRGMQFIIIRTYRYTLLLALFAYETIKYRMEQPYLLQVIKKTARKLYKTVETLRFDKMEDLRTEILDLTKLGDNHRIVLKTITSTMNRYILYFITNYQIEKNRMFDNFSSYLKNQPIILPVEVREYLLKGIPTHRRFNPLFNFHVPPLGYSEALYKLIDVIGLIDSEYLVE